MAGLRSERLAALEPGFIGRDFPVFDLAFGFILGHAVALQNLAGELVAAAGDDVEVVIGQVAPQGARAPDRQRARG